MKIACFADLHIDHEDHPVLLEKVCKVVKNENPDVIVIAGDVFDNEHINPYCELSKIGDMPIVCCLGNHEFSYFSVEDTLKFYKDLYHPESYNVHYLDVIGHYEINGVNFVGNVLWYDFSLNNRPDIEKGKIIGGWLDSTIECFDPIEENKKCKKQILDNISDGENILVTHCVPHKDLNLFSEEMPFSQYNAYSGCADFLKEIPNLWWAVCGHTHRYVAKEINGCCCINIGNDYDFKGKEFRHFMIEI